MKPPKFGGFLFSVVSSLNNIRYFFEHKQNNNSDNVDD